MNSKLVLGAGLSLVGILMGCGSSSGAGGSGGAGVTVGVTANGSTTSKTVTGAGTTVASTTKAAASGTGGDGPLPWFEPLCTGFGASPSGACVTVPGTGATSSSTGGAVVDCNPVKDTQCNIAAGEACDDNGNGAFHCFAPPPPNTVAVCGDCDAGTALCADGSTCLSHDENGLTAKCAKFCCTDADCGGTAGSCDTSGWLTVDGVGVCGTTKMP